jgi:hypothetical protein
MAVGFGDADHMAPLSAKVGINFAIGSGHSLATEFVLFLSMQDFWVYAPSFEKTFF